MSRYKPIKIKSNNLCEYGCHNRANFEFRNKRKCCSDAIQKCRGHINRVLKTKKQDIDKEGLNALQRGQKETHRIRLQHNSYAKAGKLISKTKNIILPSGKRQCDISNEKMRQTKLTVGHDGLTNAQRSARKMANKRLNDIDHNGLNQYQRWTKYRIKNNIFDNAFRKALKIHNFKNTSLIYQGSYEKKFLEQLEKQHSIEWLKKNVKRGPKIEYKDENGYSRWYISDYIIGNTVYEIKSNWTFNKRGKDLILEQKNIKKLNATKNKGYNVILVKEGIQIEY